MTRSHRVGPAVLGVFLLAATLSCHSPAHRAATAPGPDSTSTAALHPLDAKNAPAFRKAFDDARAHDRYIVALSPT